MAARHRVFGVLTAVAVVVLQGCGLFGGDTSLPDRPPPVPTDGEIVIALDRPLSEISPLIRGVSGPIDDFLDAGPTLNSWGGTRATRFNYQIGNAWNEGRDGAFRNESIASSQDLVKEWLLANDAAGIASRVAVPALGWIARDGDPETCSFPDESGTGCLTANEFDCGTTGPIADPRRANVGSSPSTVSEWIGGYERDRIAPDFLAVDNEPERWGIDHYDVHPTCADYFEILGTYVAYATALRDAAPRSQLVGPVMCCWYDFASRPGPGDGTDDDLLTWFLRELSLREPTASSVDARPLLDVVDLHFRPRAAVVNGQSDPEVDAQRMEATRELWDPEHSVGSPREAIEFLPRVRRITDEFFPGLPIMISDWRFGGEDSMSGAIAIFETLGIFAREGVYAAAHADTLRSGTPGYHAFRLFGNYDGRGGAFEGTAVEAVAERLDDVGVFAAVDGTRLRIGVINRSADAALRIGLDIGEIEFGAAMKYTYSSENLDEIVESRLTTSSGELVVDVPAMSVSMVELTLRDAVTISAPLDTSAPGSTDTGVTDDSSVTTDGSST